MFTHQKFTQEQFDSICKHAREKNKEALTGDLKSYGTLDVHLNGYTPAGWLAKEGYELAVDYLVSNFYVTLKHIAYGAAAGGQFKIVQQVMNTFNNPTFRMSIAASAAGGAARGGQPQEKIDQYIGHHYEALQFAIQEAARVGHFDTVYVLIKLGPNMRSANGELINPSYNELLSFAAYGAPLGGHFEFMYKHLIKDQQTINKAAEGTAEAGNEQETKKLIERQAAMHFVAKGTGRGDQLDMIRAFKLSHDLPMIDVLAGAMEGGYFGLVKELMDYHNVSLIHVLEFAGKNGHFNIINNLVDYYQILPMSGILQATSRAVASSGHFCDAEMATRFISLITNEALRILLANEKTDFRPAHCPPSADADRNFFFTEKVGKINTRLNQFNLNADEARALVVANESKRAFILQAYQFIPAEKWLPELYLAFAQYVLGIPDETATAHVINTIHEIHDQYNTEQHDFYFFQKKKPPIATSEPMDIVLDNDWYNNTGYSG